MKMKTLIIYSSKYGYTKKYAHWLAEELNGDIFETKNVKKNIMSGYDVIILGGGLYAGRIKGINLLVKNFEKIKDKKIILFTCGIADYNNIKNINSVRKGLENAIPKNVLEKTKLFHLRGGINYKELNVLHQMIMGMVKKVLSKKGADELTQENKDLLETFGQTLDFTDKKNITEIIEYCKGIT